MLIQKKRKNQYTLQHFQTIHFSMRKKRARASACETAIKKRKNALVSVESKMTTCKDVICSLNKELDSCVGPNHILRFKVLTAKIVQERKTLESLTSGDNESRMHNLMIQIDQLEKEHEPTRQTPTMSITNRLYPPLAHKTNIFNSMTNGVKTRWQTLRAYKKRFSLMYDKHMVERKNIIDYCADCGIDRIIDRESARSTCPQCGDCQVFASHIFDIKDMDRNEGVQTRNQSLTHMQKFMAQFERGYPCAPVSVLERLYIEFGKNHMHDPSKVNSCTTARLMKNCPNIHRTFKRAPDRISKELRADSIPEYSPEETARILNQRNRLRLPEEIHDPSSKNKKSYCNQIYLRQFGKSNNMPQSRLFPQGSYFDVLLRSVLLIPCCLQPRQSRSIWNGAGHWRMNVWYFCLYYAIYIYNYFVFVGSTRTSATTWVG